MELSEVRQRAAERLAGVCKVCRHCNGVVCAGQVPGFGGVGTGAGFIANVEALARRKLNLRVLHQAKEADTHVRLFGQNLSMPILGAAVAGVKVNRMAGVEERELTEAMILGPRLAGTLGMGGDGGDPIVFETTLSVIKQAHGLGIPVIKPRTQDALLERVRLAEEAGAVAIAVDVDAAGLINMALLGQKVEPKTAAQVREIVEATQKPVILKGIMTPEDAIVAADAGAAGIVVSNHGGRALDHTPGTADVLPQIVREVKGQLTILVDGGVRSGVDVLKMLALGADAVLVGRPLAIAAAGGGQEGVRLQLEEYRNQLRVAMVLTGCARVSDVDSSVLWQG
ncbi:MAG TPA: alpha-hydroxy-acid oxidizing protein [Firmicutes bacterium]|nr:alpha-hydroxy-acid oxidizing protein [Bacillota bacterium]